MRNQNRKTQSKNFDFNKNYLVFILLAIILILLAIVMLKVIRTNKKNRHEAEVINSIYEMAIKINSSEENNSETTDKEAEETKEDTVLNIVAIGDILCQRPIYEAAYSPNDKTYNFYGIYSRIVDYVSKADIAIGTLETTFTDTNYAGGKKYNSPKAFGETLKTIGIDVLSTATNHSYDYGMQGITNTLDYLNSLEIDTVGTYRGETQEILIKDIEGIKIAFLAYTYGSSQKIDAKSAYCLSLINKDKMKLDLEKAKAEGADFVFVNMHWGDPGSNVPNEEQKDLADFLIQNGADFVIGSHPTQIQPMEMKTKPDGSNGFVAYSLGAFTSTENSKDSSIGMILNIEITKSKDTGKSYLSNISYTPTYFMDKGNNTQNRFELLDLDDAKEEIAKYDNESKDKVSKAVYDKLQEAVEKMEKILGKEKE